MNSKPDELRPDSKAENPGPRWGLLTNHAHALVCIARDPGIRLRDIADAVGITERATHRIVSELIADGYVLRERQGRRNKYEVVPRTHVHHPLFEEVEVGDLLKVLLGHDGISTGNG